MVGPAGAQTAGGRGVKSPTPTEQPDKMFVEADELVYNKDKNTVSAEGNARIYYEGRVLEADRIIYDRNTGRVYAEGHAKLTERDGTVLHGDRFDLTKDLPTASSKACAPTRRTRLISAHLAPRSSRAIRRSTTRARTQPARPAATIP